MPVNVPGLLVPFQLLFNPRIILPNIVVKDIRHLDFVTLRRAGYRGVVFDKDNCITRPGKDTIVPEIQEAWDECRKIFGEGNVLIVSNSAGTWLDCGEIQCESVMHHTRVPVLRHRSFKPAYSCITAIRGYFSSLYSPIQDEELVVIGDRIFTDIVMANRMRGRRRHQPVNVIPTKRRKDEAIERNDTSDAQAHGPLAIWTVNVWEREAMVMRWCEKWLVNVVGRWAQLNNGDQDMARFIKKV